MDFALTAEQQMIAETAQAFFAENATSERTRAAMAADGIDRDLWTTFVQELGLGGIGLPEEFGGAGLGLVEMAIVAEAAGAMIAPLPLLGSLAMSARALAAGGSEAQQSKWLPAIASGTVVAAYAIMPRLKSENDRLTGQDLYVPHGASADLFVVEGPSGVWIVEQASRGVTAEHQVTLDETRPLCRLTLDAASGDLLPDGSASALEARRSGCIILAAEALGGAQACLDRTVGYAKERIQFGRAIGSFQAYKHRLADMMTAIEQARSGVYWAACAADEASPEAPLATHAAKSFAADTFFRCAGDMIQLHGGIGFTWEHDAHLFFKRARSIQTLLGTGDWHREQAAAIILGDAA